jgi:Protein of unknown function (DUF2384)
MAVLQQTLAGFSADTAVDLSNRAAQVRLSRVAVPAFFKLADAWALRDEPARHLLGGVSNGTFYQLKRSARKALDQDKLTRISLLLGIFRALNILYSRKLADAWINLPNANPMFQGAAPLAYMIKGGVPAFVRVRQLLDARRGGR